jgi:uncharacterized protein YwqG
MAKKEPATITDIEVARAVIANEAVDCFCGTEQKPGKQPKQLLSCTGGSFWGRPGQSWPISADGEPLIPWLQVVATEIEGLYGPFHQRKAVCFYIRQDFAGFEEISADDRADFVVREYSLSDQLLPLARPGSLAGHPFHRVIWEKVKDYPAISKYSELFDDDVYDRMESQNRSGIKIGGWPTPVQRRQEYPGTCALQIDMTENWRYGDSGIAYLSKSGDRWYVAFETC